MPHSGGTMYEKVRKKMAGKTNIWLWPSRLVAITKYFGMTLQEAKDEITTLSDKDKQELFELVRAEAADQC